MFLIRVAEDGADITFVECPLNISVNCQRISVATEGMARNMHGRQLNGEKLRASYEKPILHGYQSTSKQLLTYSAFARRFSEVHHIYMNQIDKGESLPRSRAAIGLVACEK